MKIRAPLTFDAALSRIAGQLPKGWDEMGEATGTSASYLRKCGDPDCREKLAIADAIALDLAYAAAGGEGYPLREAYDAQLEVAGAVRFASSFDLLRSTANLIKEGGEAHAALARACLPGATNADLRWAQRQLAEAFEESRKTLAVLTPVIEMHVAHPQRAPP